MRLAYFFHLKFIEGEETGNFNSLGNKVVGF